MTPATRTFSLSDPHDMYAKLALEVELLGQTPATLPEKRAYIALGAAMTAWHITEWLSRRLQPLQRKKLAALAGHPMKGKLRLQQYALEAEAALHVCRGLALGERVVQLQQQGTHVRLWVSDGMREWSVEDLLGDALAFWRDVLIAIGP